MSQTNSKRKTKVGICGFGSLGKYLVSQIDSSDELCLAFVWNRDLSKLDTSIPKELVLQNLTELSKFKVDIIVEVAHPSVSIENARLFLSCAAFFVGSPCAFADQGLLDIVKNLDSPHGTFVPSGALWGVQDIQKMAMRNSISALCVTMKKHPDSFRFSSDDTIPGCPQVKGLVVESLSSNQETLIYDGPVRPLCAIAPNNVNTMACAALASLNENAKGLGFDGVRAKLFADPTLQAHVIEVSVQSPPAVKGGDHFRATTVRHNPCVQGAVTGNATYASFFSSLMKAAREAPSSKAGLYFC